MRGGGGISVQIIGLSNSLELAGHLEDATRKLKEDVAEGVVDRIRGYIRSQSGELAGSWEGKVQGQNAVIRSQGVAYAKASVAGAYITPKRRRVLRFADGSFHRQARLTPGAYMGSPGSRKSYVDAAFQHFSEITGDVFRKHFGGLGGLG
jgi:hypothetical protein